MKFLAFLATLIFSIFHSGSTSLAPAAVVSSRQPAAVVLASADARVASSTPASVQSSPGSSPASSLPSSPTIIRTTVIQTDPTAVTSSQLDSKLQILRNSLLSEMSKISAPSSPQPNINYVQSALVNRIDQLTNTVITTPTISSPSITGGTITNVTLSNPTISSLSTLSLSGTLTGTNANFLGNVGIGTTTPQNGLHVYGATNSSTTFRIERQDGGANTASVSINPFNSGKAAINVGTSYSNEATVMTLLSNGSIGVGTVSPASKLTISKNALPTTLTTGDAYLHIGGTDEALNGYALINFGYGGTASTYSPAYMGFQETTFTGNEKGDLVFGTRDVTTNTQASERLRITSSGNVGFGTTTPWGFHAINPNGVTGPEFVIGSSTKTDFIVTNSGNVGIGTSSPSTALSVNGSGYFTGNMVLADTVSSSAGSLIIGGTSFLSDYPGNIATNGNAWIGGAGNYTLTSQKSVGVGYQALAADTSGGTNVAVGFQTMNANTQGAGNTVVGYFSLHNNTTGSQNTIVGTDAAERNNADGNTCVGFECLQLNTTGASNTALGWGAMQRNTTGFQTTALGYNALGFAQLPANDVAIGMEAAQYAIEVDNNDSNTAIGVHALYQATKDSYNTCIGRAACYNLTTGSGNINIGGFEATMFVPPDTLTLGLNSGAGLGIGTYAYKLAWTLNGQNTELQQTLNNTITTTSGNQQVSVSNIPSYSGPLTCTQTLVYRTKVGFAPGNSVQRYYLDRTIGNCSGGSFTDSVADASLVTEDASPNNTLILGYHPTAGDQTAYKSNQAVFGSPSNPYTEFWLGGGVFSPTSTPILISSTGGSGTNIAGSDLILQGGAGTGSANGGSILFQVAPAGGSGSSWNATTTAIKILSNGNVGIGTTTPTLGPLTMNSGAYVTAGGTWTNASDRNLKENFTELDSQDILKKIASLSITQWNYKTESASTTHIGPVAQDFYAAFHTGNSDTSISTIDPSGVALLGIKALYSTVSDMSKYFVNGVLRIGEIVADTVTAKKIKVTQGFEITDQANGRIYCVTIENGDWNKVQGICPDTQAASVSSSSSGSSSGSSGSPSADTTSPIITILGQNPSQISVGTAYSDMGATVTDTDASGNVNTNLGLHYSVDGASVTSVSLDTSTTTTHTIVYSALDGSGNMGYATRTVEVIPVQ
jgi:hypothetical protein